jgi:hypothetical protein
MLKPMLLMALALRGRDRSRAQRGDVPARPADVHGAPGVEVEVVAVVPPLGLWGPGVRIAVTGHAVEETAP